MSWSLSVPQSSPEDFDNNARKALKDHQDANGSWAPEQVEHFMAALKAAKAMAEALEPSNWRHQLVASMSGHANPDHDPQDGYANDTMTVTVTQVPTDPIPEPEPFTPGQPEPTPPVSDAPDSGTTDASGSQGDAPPMPSPDNPVPIEQAKDAAPAWEAMAPAEQPEEAQGGKEGQ